MIYLATDHAGFELKEKVKKFLQQNRYEIEDCGADELDPSDDYPDLIALAAAKVSSDPNSKGVIFGGSGQGEAIVANKFPNVRAVVFYGSNEVIPSLGREHNNANVLSIGARFVKEAETIEAVRSFLDTKFTNEPRHSRRIEKIKELERRI